MSIGDLTGPFLVSMSTESCGSLVFVVCLFFRLKQMEFDDDGFVFQMDL